MSNETVWITVPDSGFDHSPTPTETAHFSSSDNGVDKAEVERARKQLGIKTDATKPAPEVFGKGVDAAEVLRARKQMGYKPKDGK